MRAASVYSRHTTKGNNEKTAQFFRGFAQRQGNDAGVTHKFGCAGGSVRAPHRLSTRTSHRLANSRPRRRQKPVSPKGDTGSKGDVEFRLLASADSQAGNSADQGKRQGG